MARCGGSEQVLKELLLNIVDHYQVLIEQEDEMVQLVKSSEQKELRQELDRILSRSRRAGGLNSPRRRTGRRMSNELNISSYLVRTYTGWLYLKTPIFDVMKKGVDPILRGGTNKISQQKELTHQLREEQLIDILEAKVNLGGYFIPDFNRQAMLEAMEAIPSDLRERHNARLINRLIVRANAARENTPIIILAGYQDHIEKEVFALNPGFRSRFALDIPVCTKPSQAQELKRTHEIKVDSPAFTPGFWPSLRTGLAVSFAGIELAVMKLKGDVSDGSDAHGKSRYVCGDPWDWTASIAVLGSTEHACPDPAPSSDDEEKDGRIIYVGENDDD
ncbi:hypothetical protein Bbelb_350450 [Branchiostoma belcheri]|nr:hypothetical protein Bbelb_350450 [Branchiostoma belcheri]